MTPRGRDLVLVSAGLSLDGGGSALLGRLIATAAAIYCRERGLDFRVLHLGREPGVLQELPVRSFDGDQKALALAVAAEQMRRRRPVLIFDHLGPARVQARLPRFLRSPYVVFLLGIEVWGPLAWDRRRALQGADLRIAISDYTRRRAMQRHPWLGKTQVLHLALEERPPAGEVDAALLDRLGEGFLLIVGRMSSSERYKGHDEILEALPAVAAEHPGVRLVVVGGGDDRPRLEAKAAELGLAERVLFTGHVPEATLAEIYRRSSIFVMPSRDEGFGLVYLEAIRAGKPCLATRGGAAEEILADGETGILTEPQAEAVASGLLSFLGKQPSLRPRSAAERFGFARFSSGLAAHLDQVAS